MFVSDLVQEEAGKGDPEAAVKRLKVISEFLFLEIDDEASRIAKFLVANGAIPPEYPGHSLRDVAYVSIDL